MASSEIEMRTHFAGFFQIVAAGIAALFAPIVTAQVGTAFSYQAELRENGVAKVGTVDLKFTAFDPRGDVLGVPAILDSVPLDAQGRFTVQIDFGNVFGFEPTQIEVAVREDALGDASNPAGFTALLPRQQVSPTPLAQFAERVGNNAVSGASIVNESVTGGDIDDGSIRAADANTTSVLSGLQRHVSGECQEDRAAIRAINDDGSIQCVYLDAAASIAPVTADAAGDVGEFVSVASSTSNSHSATYYDRSNTRLKYVSCSALGCQNPVVLDDTLNRDVGQHASLSLSLSGGARIAYYDATVGDLKLAICGNTSCTGAIDIRTLDSTGDVGRFAAITRNGFDSGNVVVAYYDATNNRYKVARCQDSACTSHQITTLDEFTGGGVGGSAIAISDSQGAGPRILLLDGGSTATLVRCANTLCNARSVGAVFPGSARAPLALAARRIPNSNDPIPLWAAHANTSGTILVRQCDDDACVANRSVGGVSFTSALDSTLSITLRPEQIPLLLGVTSASTAMSARMSSRSSFPLNSGDSQNALSAAGVARTFIAAAHDGNGEVGVFYHDANDDLIYQRCARSDCSDQ